jgi:hypothetical protein
MRPFFQGGMTRQPTQLAKVTPFASGNEGTLRWGGMTRQTP